MPTSIHAGLRGSIANPLSPSRVGAGSWTATDLSAHSTNSRHILTSSLRCKERVMSSWIQRGRCMVRHWIVIVDREVPVSTTGDRLHRCMSSRHPWDFDPADEGTEIFLLLTSDVKRSLGNKEKMRPNLLPCMFNSCIL